MPEGKGEGLSRSEDFSVKIVRACIGNLNFHHLPGARFPGGQEYGAVHLGGLSLGSSFL